MFIGLVGLLDDTVLLIFSKEQKQVLPHPTHSLFLGEGKESL